MNTVFTYIKKGVFLTDLTPATGILGDNKPKDPD